MPTGSPPQAAERPTHRVREGRPAGSRKRAIWLAAAAVTTGTVAVSGVALASSPSGDSGATGENSLSAVVPRTHLDAQTGAVALAAAAGRTIGQGSATGSALRVAAPPADAAGATRLVMSPQRTKVTPNQADAVIVRLWDLQTRAGAAGRNVRIMRADGFQWKTTAVLRTDAHGYARVTARLLTTTRIVAVFDGVDSLMLPSASDEATMTVVEPPPPPPSVLAADGSGSGAGSGSTSGSTTEPASSVGARAVALAAQEQGKPYVWGGNGPDSFDCSGLTSYVYRQLGRSLPRTADAQYWATTHIAQSAMQPGDLIFYGPPGSIYHVAIYAGNGMMWEAPQTGDVVHLTAVRGSSYHVGRVL